MGFLEHAVKNSALEARRRPRIFGRFFIGKLDEA
jgi:hypothetical protein